MAQAMKCDICGKLYEPYGTDKDEDIPNALTLNQRMLYVSGGNKYTLKTYDCCPECMNDIRTYIGILGARKS